MTLLRKPFANGIPEQGSFPVPKTTDFFKNLMVLFKIGMVLFTHGPVII